MVYPFRNNFVTSYTTGQKGQEGRGCWRRDDAKGWALREIYDFVSRLAGGSARHHFWVCVAAWCRVV